MCPADDRTGRVALLGACAATEVYLIDSAFELRAGALARLEASVPAGVYQARFQLGSDFKDVPFKVGAGEDKELRGPRQVTASAAPLEWTRLRGAKGGRRMPREERREIWRRAAEVRPGEGEGVLHVLLRSDRGAARTRARVDLLAPGGPDPAPLRWRELPGARMGTACLPAGTHVLAVSEGDARFCRSVPVAPGCQTVLSMHALPLAPADRRVPAAVLASSLLVWPHPASGEEEELLVQDMAQQALQRSRALMGPSDLRGGGPFSPMATLLGAHGLLEARRARMPQPLDPVELTREEAAAVGAAYRKLRKTWLAGSADVAALGLAAGQRAPQVDLDVPPLLVSTWRTLVSASLTRPRSIRGGSAALGVAEGLIASSLWLTWVDRARSAAAAAGHGRDLGAGARDLLEPELRPAPGKLPSWVETREVGELVEACAPSLARGLQLPVPLVVELARNLAEERGRSRERRVQRRLQAMRAAGAKVCLVALPDGVRADPAQGKPIDFDAVFDLVDDLAARAGLVAVRTPPVGLESEEMREAIARADVLVADLTFGDPGVMAVTGAWLTQEAPGHRGPAARLVLLRADRHLAAPRPAEAAGLIYSATFGMGLSFADPEAARRALAAAAQASARRPEDRPRKAAWLRHLARAERRRLELRDLAARARKLLARKKRRQAVALLRRALPRGALRREPSAVQLDAFLLFRAFGDWRGMVRVEGEMRPPLRRMPLVREQRALALKWSGTRNRQELALRLLRSVLEELGRNGETCGNLGSVCKARWLKATRSGDRAAAERRLDEAILWYRRGMRSSPLDPYPGVNVLTLLAVKGTSAAMAEHAHLLPQVELATQRRLHQRPSYWDLVAMVELAANRRDRTACDFYLRLALAAPHEPWQRRTAALNLGMLLKAPAPDFKRAAPWLRSAISALARGRAGAPGQGGRS